MHLASIQQTTASRLGFSGTIRLISPDDFLAHLKTQVTDRNAPLPQYAQMNAPIGEQPSCVPSALTMYLRDCSGLAIANARKGLCSVFHLEPSATIQNSGGTKRVIQSNLQALLRSDTANKDDTDSVIVVGGRREASFGILKFPQLYSANWHQQPQIRERLATTRAAALGSEGVYRFLNRLLRDPVIKRRQATFWGQTSPFNTADTHLFSCPKENTTLLSIERRNGKPARTLSDVLDTFNIVSLGPHKLITEDHPSGLSQQELQRIIVARNVGRRNSTKKSPFTAAKVVE